MGGMKRLAGRYRSPTLFDAIESQAKKDEGMVLAAEAGEDALVMARQIAIQIARSRPSRECHADDVGLEMEKRGISLGPAAGSIFKGGGWEFTGRRVRSARKKNHARELKVWRLL
jgi:hypothetical protein